MQVVDARRLTYRANATVFAATVEGGGCRRQSGASVRPCREWLHELTLRNGASTVAGHRRAHNASSLVDGVVVVHYSRAPCRKLRFQQRLKRVGLPYTEPWVHWAEHIDGMEALTASVVDKCVACGLLVRAERGGPPRLQSGELTVASCALNHMYAHHFALVAGWQRTLILEDDAWLPDGVVPRLWAQMARLPRDWIIHNFGCPYPRMDSPMRGGALICSRAYLLSRAGVVAFARNVGVVDRPADWMIHGLSAATEVATSTRTWHSGVPVRELSVRAGVKLPRTRPDDSGCGFEWSTTATRSGANRTRAQRDGGGGRARGRGGGGGGRGERRQALRWV